ncbi:hypothetical protein PAE9249_04063 [Paenibacillus sp. CECT 9249]|nr:hypothetical protein PAE9249_04063 [Paenibacillus sp. CECT 9249]
MLSKFFIFSILLYITRNPLLAILLLLVILYFLDRRYVGLSPSLMKPFKLANRISKLRTELRNNPHHASSKFELARCLIERKNYREALEWMKQLEGPMEDSADLHAEMGLCYLKLGDLEQGERYMEKALTLNPRVRYGEPYLRLGEAYAPADPEKAIRMLESFRQMQSSSCEAYYRLGLLYAGMGRQEEAKAAFRETLEIYRSLPKYNKRKERRWALLARFKA